jgi:signal transduction histidine kinase
MTAQRESTPLVPCTVEYRSPDELGSVAARYVSEALADDAVVVTITTSVHRVAILAELEAHIADVRDALVSNRLMMLDVREILGAVVAGDRIDGARFAAVVERAIERAAQRRRGADIRVLTELTEVLVLSGRATAAREMDELWEGLALRHPLTLTALSCAADASPLPPKALPLAPERPPSGVRRRSQPPPDMSVVLHDLRGTLNAILGWTTVLEDAVQSTPAKLAVEAVLRNVEIQTRMLDDLYDAYEIDAGRLALARTPTDLVAVVRDAVATSLRTAQTRNVAFVVATPATAALVGDPSRIHQALVGILGWAIRHAARGGSVRIGLARADAEWELDIATSEGREPRWETTSELGVRNARAILELHGGQALAGPEGSIRIRVPVSTSDGA